MLVAARVYRYINPGTGIRYNVIAHMPEPMAEVPAELDAQARSAGYDLAVTQLAGYAELERVEDWNAGELSIMTGMMPKGTRPELN
jgi:hypothetical protein